MPDEPLNLGLLLFIPYRAMESAVLDELRSHGHPLTLSQARVFQRIGPDGSRPGELAEAAQLSKQTLGSILDQLEAAGYVTRVPDPTDGRARLVTITDDRTGAGGVEPAGGGADGARLEEAPGPGAEPSAPRGARRAAADHRPVPNEQDANVE